MSRKNLLLEIVTEELPTKLLRSLAESFTKNFTSVLDSYNIAYDNIEWFATPRRLALKVINLALFQPDRIVKKYGPSVLQAFDNKGNPNEVAKNWARDCGIDINQAERLITDKGEWLFCHKHIKGKSIEFLLSDIIVAALIKKSFFKLMRWGEGNIYFVRPVHSVILLLDDTVIPVTILGIQSDRVTYGHRFMGESQFAIDNANQYPRSLLERGKVIADYQARKTKIKIDAEEIAHKIGGNIYLNENLLEEITSLVEWPVVLSGKFEQKFLTIPEEIAISIIKDYQKYFPVYSSNGKLMPNFIFVANIESSNPQQIIAGNENVIRARLADANFFFKIDCKKPLEDNLPLLQHVSFQQQLGTMYDKTNRISDLAGWIASKIGANVKNAIRAGMLSKCDLITNMVCEFTDTQGIMGMYYARYNGEVEDVAIALNEQYKPRFSGDTLPTNLVSCALSIADKMDTLTGIFGISKYPKGDKDPFALRRAAFGILRILIDKNLNLDLQTMVEKTVHLYNNKLTNIKVVDDVINFILERFYSWYTDTSIVQAVLACRPTRPIDFNARVKAILYFRTLKESSELIKANKRVSNILAKSNEILNNTVCTSILREVAEIKLANNLNMLYNKLKPYLIESRYREVLIELISLQELIDEFFNTVMVNTSNKELRINRLTLLSKLHNLFLQVADITLLQ